MEEIIPRSERSRGVFEFSVRSIKDKEPLISLKISKDDANPA
jgi:hypothetical protein